jgi:hypothetical protein
MTTSCPRCSWRTRTQTGADLMRVALVALHSVPAGAGARKDTRALDALTDGMCLRCLRDVIDQTAILSAGIANRLGVEDEWRAVVANLVPLWAVRPLEDAPP